MGKRLIRDNEREDLVKYLDACQSDTPWDLVLPGSIDTRIPEIASALRAPAREETVLLPLSRIEAEALIWMRLKMRVQDQGGTVTTVVPTGPHKAALRRLCERVEKGMR